jgi:SAM-dependent methyltransferase
VTTRYDAVRYTGHAYAHTHPDRLAVVGRLFGLDPAPPERCRVLELGAGSGANLLPMAVRLPESRFEGVDLAASAVADGQAAISELGLSNARMEARDILTLDDGFAEFDYVICHGVYSWVPADVRERILRLARSCLAPNGIAYVSYNTLPGWHLLNIARDVLRVHGERFEAPMEQVQQGLAMLGCLAEGLAGTGEPYAGALAAQREMLTRHSPDYVYHDFFSPVNVPFLFRDFVRDASAADLQYLGEADFGLMLTTGLPRPLSETLDAVATDIVSNEQYIDFVRCRTFRRTLLCRPDVPIDRRIGPERLHGLRVAATPALAGIQHATEVPFQLAIPGAASIVFDTPIATAALRLLWESRDESILYEELVARAREAVGDVSTDDPIAAAVVHAYAQGAVQLVPRRQGVCLAPGERPVADRWARRQASRGGTTVVTLRHEGAPLDRLDQELLPRLDGSRGMPELVAEILDRCAAGALEVKDRAGADVPDAQRAAAVGVAVGEKIAAYAKAALLVR